MTIRELVANALIHPDFTLSGMSVMVEVYADRVEISSPGEPLVPVERFNLPESKAESVSRAIRDAMEAGKLKLFDPKQRSLRYRSYVPYWA